VERITSRESFIVSVWKGTPRPVKILVLLQTVIIVSLSFWIYEEYLNNQYLQKYVNGSLGGSLFSIILVAIGSFTGVVLVLFAKLRSARRELGGIRSKKRLGSDGREQGRLLDPQVEQHLIEMIRKTQPGVNSGTASDEAMPVLRRRDYSYAQEKQDSSQ
jgi:hypothetical protein